MTNAAQQVPRQAIINAINDPAAIPFYYEWIDQWGGLHRGIGTPLAEALYNVGQYFTATGNSGLYPTQFGTSWTNSSFAENSQGAIGSAASWVGSNQHSICWSCEQSSIVVITDGQPSGDNNLPRGTNAPSSTHTTIGTAPNGDFVEWSNSTVDCSDADCGTDKNNSTSNLLHKVAYFLRNTDLRSDSFTIGSGSSAVAVNMDPPAPKPRTQSVTTYTISFGLHEADDPKAVALLQKTADLGGGTFTNSADGSSLNQALYNAVTDVVSRATSFSNSNTSTLQTTGGDNQIFLTRFRPHSGPSWEGHVYRFRLFYEFAEGCDATQPNQTVTCGSASIYADLNRDGTCDGLFKLDQDCDPVTEDADGNFVKATFDSTTHVLQATTTAATPFWDAGAKLSDSGQGGAYRSAAESGASKRLIYTVADTNSDGLFTTADGTNGLTEFTTANVASLAPLMQLDPTWCLKLFQRIGLCGPTSPLPACPTVASWATQLQAGVDNTNLCADQVIYHVRGFDALDQDGDGCAGPGNPSNVATTTLANGTSVACGSAGEQRDRANDSRDEQEFWKLGDVFHSSPIMVKPPIDEFTCDLAIDPQCVATIHSPQGLTLAVQTPMDCTTSGATNCDVNGDGALGPAEDAYSMYRNDNLGRQEILLVGANDGMLHAFDAGTARTAQSKTASGDYSFTAGSGAELWAFIPPDLLPKLRDALEGHTYFVDGDVMVRDVWQDADLNGKKTPNEFHTLAVISERSGGSAFTALDITNTTGPKLRWVFPQLCTQDVNLVGQSWTGFAPRPPPIGPVQIKLPYTGGPADPSGRGFEERWIVALNGGYDPGLTRGKGVWLVDAWTGDVLWRFTNDDFQNDVNNNGAMWPVAASPALVDTGKSADASAEYDGFFDTLTWADIGGQTWVARLDPPGVIDGTTHRVNNWAAARSFEEQRQGNDSQLITGRSEFYFMPANAVDSATKYLHTYVGSGNREHLLQVGAACGPDNVLACCQAGCNVVDVTTQFNYAGSSSCDFQQHFKCQGGRLTQDKTKINNTDVTSGSTTCQNLTCGGLNANIQLHLECGNAGNPPDVIAHLKCDQDGVCCQVTDPNNPDYCKKVTKGKTLNPARLTQPTNHSRFYGIWSYGGSRTFTVTASDFSQAATFDQNRFTDITYGGTCAGTPGGTCTLIDTTQATISAFGGVACLSGTTCSATSYDAGWFYEYGKVCPTGSSCTQASPAPSDGSLWLDEKTGSASDVTASCAVWNTFRPLGSGVSTAPCTTSSGQPQNYNYLANALTGVPDTKCGYQASSAINRAATRQAVAPPLAPTWLMALSHGSVQAATGQPGDPGAPTQTATPLGGTRSLSQQGYWLEVPRDLHQCRHVSSAQCE
jgi:type IV pilus assembly protein PilY1